MCYKPITIINPTKYISLKYRDRYLLQVPCGKCAACMQQKSNEWYYRIYHHALDTFSHNGFILFDTLTYAPKFLPHISRFLDIPKKLDFPCFDPQDIRLFVARLRQHLKRNYKANFDYFIVSEYGTDSKHLHRPHYHALFFVRGDITNLQFSSLVSLFWSNGRTDGLPFRSTSHVNYNTFSTFDFHSVKALKYITKYIQKSCQFQSEINSRLDKIMGLVVQKFESQGLENWSQSSHYWRVRDKLSRHISQFHRQSSHLGECALSFLDVNDVFNTGALFIPDDKSVVLRLNLPTYFKRKLFYQLYEVDGAKTWQPTEFGYSYLESRLKVCLKNLTDRFAAISEHVKSSIPVDKLADYVLNWRGRFCSQLPPSHFEDRLYSVNLFNYATRYDRESLCTGLTPCWHGNSSIGYSRKVFGRFIPFSQFIKEYVYLNADYEAALDILYSHSLQVDSDRQKAYQLRQRLTNLYHSLII